MNLKQIRIYFKTNMPKFIWCGMFVLLMIGSGNYGYSQDEGYHKSVINEGIKIDFTLTHIDPEKQPGVFTEGDDVLFRFAISDTITNAPLSGAFPAAWMDKVERHVNRTSCGDKVVSYIEGKLLSRAELDLNVYYVLTLNHDNTISVVDPLFGYGGSKLLHIIQLESTGYDWVTKENQTMIYVSMPEASQVAAIRASDWKVMANIPVGGKPKKILLQADEHYLWTTYSLQGNFEMNSGVAVIDTETNTLVKNIETGKGKHTMAMSDDNKYVYISNSDDGTISVIDAHTLEKIKDVKLNGVPHSMAYSSLAKALYVVNSQKGTLIAIDGTTHEVIKTMQAVKGIDKIAFAPGGRLAFVNNPTINTVDIFDVAVNRLIQTGDVAEQPDQITFTDEQAYIRHRGSEIIWMIPLDAIGVEGAAVPIIDFSGGAFPPSAGSPECGALGIVQAPGANAVLVSNYKDKVIYYYKEGMASTMGSFSTYGSFPKAVAVIDRSIEERNDGEYETVAKLSSSGTYSLALFLNVPLVMECFDITVLPDPIKEKARIETLLGPLIVKHFPVNSSPNIGDDVTLRFQLLDINTNEPVTGLSDVRVMQALFSKNTSEQTAATETHVDGVYEITTKFEEEGLYYVYVGCASHKLSFNNPQFITLYASNPKSQ